MVTGATRGLGKVTTELLLTKGYSVLVTSRSEKQIEDLKLNFPQHRERIKSLCIDFLSPSSPINAYEYLLPHESHLLGIVHNAGGTTEYRSAHDPTDAWLRQFRLSVFFAKELNAQILKSPGDLFRNLRTIVHISSASANNLLGSQLYGISKGLLNLYIRAAGRDSMRERGVSICGVSPGAFTSPDGPWESKSHRVKTEFLEKYQLSGRLGNAEQVAMLILCLLGPTGEFATGSILDLHSGSI